MAPSSYCVYPLPSLLFPIWPFSWPPASPFASFPPHSNSVPPNSPFLVAKCACLRHDNACTIQRHWTWKDRPYTAPSMIQVQLIASFSLACRHQSRWIGLSMHRSYVHPQMYLTEREDVSLAP